jgi:type IV secretion system protein VirB3
MASGRLQADPLFQGLTRPAMIMGVSYMFFVLNMVITMIGFIGFDSFTMLITCAPTLHALGYLICMKEPRAIELGMIRMQKCFKCLNRPFHGNTNSYDVF